MRLGDHILYLGDFFRRYTVIPWNSVDQVITDPPWGILQRMLPWDKKIDLGLLAGIFNLLLTATGQIAVICNDRMIPDLIQALNRHFKFRYQEVRLKPSAQTKGLDDRPRPDVDYVLVFDRKGSRVADHIFNWQEVAQQRDPYSRVNRNLKNATMPTLKREVDINETGLRRLSTVVKVPNRPAMAKEEKTGVTHPFQKSLAHTERLVRLLTRPGQSILDPFMGSGTTLVAAARCGRTGLGFEMERRFFNQAKRRIKREIECAGVAADV